MTSEPDRPRADTGTVNAESPWPGLAPFRESDQAFFHGREQEVEELFDLITRERAAVFFGLSGLGKTSLLQAGLFPRLRQEDIFPVYLRLDFSREDSSLISQVLAAIAFTAAADGVEVPEARDGDTLWEFFHRRGSDFWSPHNRLVTPLLIFDQFEEVFTIGQQREEETRAFLEELADVAEGRPPASLKERLEANPDEVQQYSFSRQPCKILLSLREDFLAELETLSDRIRSIQFNRFRLLRMNGDNALQAVTGVGGHLIQEDVARQVVSFVAGRENRDGPLDDLEIEPALLSVVCYELNNQRRRRGESTITASLLAGSRDQVLSDFYERSLADLGPEVREFIEEQLLTLSGFRDSIALENALAVPGVTQEVLDRLIDRRLLRLEDRGGIQRIELTHDVLTVVIRTKRDVRRKLEALEGTQVTRQEVDERERLVRWNRWLIAVVVVLAALLLLLIVFTF